VNNLKELKIWTKAIDLSVDVYVATADFPSEEKFGLTSQIRRSAVSISSNIAEGAGRSSSKEFNYFLSVANGSSFELQTQLVISGKLEFISDEVLSSLLTKIDELQKMNHGFQKMLTNKASIK
jgi:four helix bundle protein